MNDILERAKQIYADICEDDPMKPKAWDWVIKAYELRGEKIEYSDFYKQQNYKEPGICWLPGIWNARPQRYDSYNGFIGTCAPLFENLDAMRTA